ncbi:ATP-dependent 6-phosphofructokinase [Verrucomicrobia bacterium LW23]|nr:ATP-dependent 6-phosphofructokinase [Verrucomicrobia bacterium LW23]
MKRIAVLTSGGDSPGMNPAIRAVTRTAINFGIEVFGIRNGYAGLLAEELEPLDNLMVSGINRVAGTMLQTSRCKEFHELEVQKRALSLLEKHRIEGLVVIGGDGSLTGARALHRLGVPVVGMPGTIDNDIAGTEMGIGVDTALNTIISMVDMIKATASSHSRCFIVEVMGRGSGYLALMSAISTGSQVAVIPEYRLNYERIVELLDVRFRTKHTNCVIIVAEGVCPGHEFMQRLMDTGKGRIQQDVRLTVLGHVQRGGIPSHFDRYLGSRMGEMAVLALTQGERGVMVAQVNGRMQLRDFDDILSRRKTIPADSIRLARNLGIEVGDAVEVA